MLGQPPRSIISDAHGRALDQDDQGLLRPDHRVWRRLLLPRTARSGAGSETRFVIARYRTDTDRIWYVQAPAMSGLQPVRIGRLSTDLRYEKCVVLLGEPQRAVQKAPAIRIAWWDIGAMTYRVEFYSEDYEGAADRGRRGELRVLAAYRPDLAPAGFDDRYAFWKEIEGK